MKREKSKVKRDKDLEEEGRIPRTREVATSGAVRADETEVGVVLDAAELDWAEADDLGHVGDQVYGLPLEGITLILGVDELMDMARTTVNVIGNCLATVVVAKWEGEFRESKEAAGRGSEGGAVE